MIRSFVALPVPASACRALETRQTPIAGARPVPDEDFHLTLAFLGDQHEADLRSLCQALEQRAARQSPLEVTLAAPMLVGGKAPRALALEASGVSALHGLHKGIGALARQTGMDLPRRRFRPHVTLYRLPRTLPATGPAAIQTWLSQQAGRDPITFTAENIVLYESHLTRDGPIYTPLATLPLGADLPEAAPTA